MLRLLAPGAKSTEPGPPEASQGSRDDLRALALKAAAGESAAQRTLLCAVGPALLRVVRGALGAHHPDVDDVFQESCVALLGALPRFRGECTTLHFACRIAVHASMGARRRMRRVPHADYDIDEEVESGASTPADVVLRARQREALRQLMDELPAARAEVLVLHVMLGYTVEETSLATGVPVNTVRSRLRRALGALRSRLQEDRQLLEVIRGGHEA